jgi:hypothetical protein
MNKEEFFTSEPFTLDSSFYDITQEKVVDPGEAITFLEITRRDPAHAIAGNMLRNALFSEDLQVKIINNEIKKNLKEIDLYFSLFFTPVGQLCERDRVALGYTCWTYTEIEDDRFQEEGGKIMIPVHVHRERYDILIRTHKDDRVEYILSKRGSKTPLTNYHLFIWPGMEPDSKTGRHNSIVTPLAEEHFRLQKLRMFDDRANLYRAHPVYSLEPTPDGAQNAAHAFTIDSLSNTHAQDTHKQKLIGAVNESSLSRDLSGVKATPEEIPRVFLPHGYKASSSQPPIPEAPADMLERTLSYQKLVFANYGIPFSLALGDGKTTSSGGAKQTANLGGEKDYEMFQKSLLQATNGLESLYAEIWHHLYPGSTKRGDAKFIQRRIPFTSTGSIHLLKNQGVLTEKSFKKRLAQLHGLSEDDVADEPEDIIRPPPHGTENHTTGMMKMKERVMLAEAKEREAKARSLEQGGTEGEKEILNLQIELEREKASLQIKILQAKLEHEQQKLELEKQRIPLERERAEIQMKQMKKKQKTSSST